LDRIMEWRGQPKTIRCDNGPDYISETPRNMVFRSSISNPASLSRTLMSSARTGRLGMSGWINTSCESVAPYRDCSQSPTGQHMAQDQAI
jgi:hypothetical protein